MGGKRNHILTIHTAQKTRVSYTAVKIKKSVEVKSVSDSFFFEEILCFSQS